MYEFIVLKKVLKILLNLLLRVKQGLHKVKQDLKHRGHAKNIKNTSDPVPHDEIKQIWLKVNYVTHQYQQN